MPGDLILISAMTRSRVIGNANALPWSIPDEYAQFLDHVRGYPVVFGRASFEIFGADLTESALVVVSRSAQQISGAEVFADLDGALAHARGLSDRVFVAGGGSIYRQTLPLADALYLSIVTADYAGDTYFPEFAESEWKVTRRLPHAEFEFREYRRRP